MQENDIYISETQDDIEIDETTAEAIDVVESDNHNVDIFETQDDVEIEEVTVEVIDVTESENYNIDMFEAFPSLTDVSDNFNHALMNNRELHDQHPISAITGLRNELDKIEALQPIFSNQIGMANYYKWNSGAYDEVGYFVSLVENTSTIQICDGSNIFGVTTDVAGFIGGQDGITLDYVNGFENSYGAARGNDYALVATTGLVDVRCELDVKVGDCVISNAYGIATKTSSDCGYKVIAINNKRDVLYASIALGVQACVTDGISKDIQQLSDRVDASETNIISAMNVANEAYNKASNSSNIADEAIKKALEALGESNDVSSRVDDMETNISSISQSTAQAKTIAESAATSAESARVEASEKTNEALASTSELRKDFEKKSEEIDAELNTAALELQKTNEELSKTRDQLQSNIDGVSGELDNTKKDLNNTRNELLGNIDSVSSDLDNLVKDVEPLVEWKGETDKTLVAVQQKADANESSIKDITVWQGETDKSIASVQETTNKNEASIKGITEWQGTTNTTITQVTQKADENTSNISLITEWKTNVEDDVNSIAAIKAQSDANKSTIEGLTSWKNTTSDTITSVKQQSDTNKASIENITSWQNEVNKSITDVEQQANEHEASITSITEWQGKTDKSISSINQKVDANESSISSLTTWQGEANTSIANVEQKVTSNETKIEALTSWQGETNEAITDIEQMANDNVASINSIATWKNNLTIGGRNLLPYTDFGGETKRYERLPGGSSEGGFYFTPVVQVESGVDYVLSAKIRGTSAVVFYEINDGGNFAHLWIAKGTLSETEYQMFSITFNVDINKTFKQVYICTQWGSSVEGEWFEIAPMSLKLERGNMATDWTPAPEDATESIAAVKQQSDANESNIQALTTWQDSASKSIASVEEKANKNEASINSLTEWQNGVNTSISSIEQTATEHESSINSLTSWQSEAKTSITNVEQKASENESKIGTLTTWQGATNTSMARIEQKADVNGASINSMVSNIDKYSVGEYSQAYGLSREQAKSILQQGMVYIPTAHKDSISHEETFVGENTSEKFTPKYYYIWNGEDWEESASPLVAFFSEEPEPNRVLKYWYIDSDTAPEGHEPHALYIYEDEQWKKVNILDGNITNRVVSMIRQSTDEISIEVVNARGNIASLKERIDPMEAKVQTVTEWHSAVKDDVSKIAAIEQTASDASASVAMVVRKTENGNEIDSASIIMAINDDGENFICADADYIDFKGKTLNLESEQFTITAKDGFRLDENGITWGANGGPLQMLYSSKLINKPVDGAQYSSFPDSSTTGWHKIFVTGDMYATDTGDGGATWTNPRQIVGEDGESVELTQDNVFNALTLNGTVTGMTRGDDGKLYINANYINAGTIKADYIDVAGVITAGEAYIGNIVTDTLNATTITANALKITNTSSGVLFNASENSVTIGGFSVGTNSIYKDKASYSNTTAGVYIGTDGIGLGAGLFHVTSAGYLTSTSGKIGGWTLSSNGFFSSGYTNGIPTIGFGSSMGYKTNNSSQQEVVFYVNPRNVNTTSNLINADFMITKNSEIYANMIYLGDCIDIDTNGFYVYTSPVNGQRDCCASILKGGSTFNSIVVEDGIDPSVYDGCSLGSQNFRWSNIYSSALNVSGGATITGTLSAGSFNPSSISTGSISGTKYDSAIKCWYLSVEDSIYSLSNYNTFGNCYFNGHLTPNGTCNLGNSTNKWSNVYASTLHTVNINVDGDLLPKGTQCYLGNSIHRWLDIHTKFLNGTNIATTSLASETSYMASAPIGTSDANAKNSIELMNDKYSDIFDDLKPVSFKFNDGESGRTHTGLIAQDVKATLEKFNVSTTDFAAYCSWKTEDGTETCGLRYEEFISMNIYEIQKLKARVAELENQINALYN